MEDTDWREGARDKWGAIERAVLRRNWLRSVDRDSDYDRGRQLEGWKKGTPEPWLLCHTFILYHGTKI